MGSIIAPITLSTQKTPGWLALSVTMRLGGIKVTWLTILASAGTETMKKARGYTIICDPARPTQEIDTYTCCHCNRLVDKPAGMSNTNDAIGAWCTCCDAAMCLQCVGKGCLPIERWLEQQETRRNYENL